MDNEDFVKDIVRGIEENGTGFHIIDNGTWLKAYNHKGRIKVVVMWEGWWYSDIECFYLENYRNASQEFITFREESIRAYQRLSNFYSNNGTI